MSKKRFTDEQIADFLRQAKEGVPDKALCEKYAFSISTLRRWKALHDSAIRQNLKKNGIYRSSRLFGHNSC